MALREDLLRLLADQGVDLSADPDDAAPLLADGRVDSLALFNLVLWIEERTGQSVDPTAVDVTREWGCVRDILAFVAGRGAAD